jgi:hypothetical protein
VSSPTRYLFPATAFFPSSADWQSPERVSLDDPPPPVFVTRIGESEPRKRSTMQSHLGHSSITVTLDRYGHLFPDDMDRLADGLEKTYRDSLAAQPRPRHGPEVVELSSP